MNLSELKTGEIGVIKKVNGSGAFRKRILEMGFIKGKEVKVILNAPLKDPIKYKIMDYEVSLRRSEALLIEVVFPNDQKIEQIKEEYNFENSQREKDSLFKKAPTGEKKITVALVGNPNAGKTSLFNNASGGHGHVGNYGGVTIDLKEGKFKHDGYDIKLIDLPGTYSISAYTPEELYVRKYLIEEKPDIVINVVAASNLERNLYLTTELIDLETSMIIDLNMYDELLARGNEFDYKKLSNLLGMPIIPTVSRSGQGIKDLFDAVIRVYEEKEPIARKIKIYYGNQIENAISKINILIEKQRESKSDCIYPIRYLSIKLLEKDSAITDYIQRRFSNAETIVSVVNSEISNLENILKEDTESAITNSRYGFVSGALKETYKDSLKDFESTRIIDAVVTNKYLGFPLFLLFMWIMFECTFRLGNYPMEWIEAGVVELGNLINRIMPDGMLRDLIVGGIIGGVGGVIVFLPNIVILYAFISFMEDSGYMARTAFIMDKLMHKMGLHGKSFIPLIMGFGCNVPAIMATRTIESKNNRMITMLIVPFMSCNARLPVYILFTGIFFKEYAGLVLFGLYFTGIIIAVLSARLFKRFFFSGKDTPFVMELPPYRKPTIKSVLIHMWDKSNQYLKKMGGVILVASIIIWFLSYFPLNEEIDNQIQVVEQTYAENRIDSIQMEKQIRQLNIAKTENSYIGIIGKFIEPVVKPLGFDWKIGVSLVSGMAAKEIVISTLGILYTGDHNLDEEAESLKERLANAKNPDGNPAFTPLIVGSLLLFILIYFPCIATIAAIKGESGSWKWAVFTIAYTTILAWIVSFLVFQIGSFFT